MVGKIERYTNKICFIACCVIIAYATLIATGDFSKWLGGFNIWGTAVAVMIICAIPGMLKNFKEIIKNSFLWLLVGYGVWNILCLLIGFKNGNDTGRIIADIGCVVYMVLFPAVLYVLNSKKRVYKLMHIAVITSIVLGLCSIILLWCYVVAEGYLKTVVNFYIGGSFINYTQISDTIPRILFVSTPLQLYGCAFSVYFMATKAKHFALYISSCTLTLFSVVMTFTRAMYLAAAVAALFAVALMLFFYKKNWKHIVTGVIASAIGCVILVGVFSVIAKTNYFSFAITRSTATTETVEIILEENSVESVGDLSGANKYISDTVESDRYREELKKSMLAIIKKSPIIGEGLGTIPEIKETTPEYSYLDVAIKTGWTGLLLYLLPCALLAVSIIRDIVKKRNVSLSCIWLSALAGQLAYAIFQPYVYSGMSTLLYCCVLAVYSFERKQLD